MKTFTDQAAQGDILIRRVDALPDGLDEIPPENGHLVLAHSETGHHHVMDAKHVRAYRPTGNAFFLFIVVDEPTALEHLRSFDRHESLMHEPGVYRIDRQREYTPEGFRRVED